MKELVIKTVLITLASVLGVFLLVFGALALFSPLTLAKLFDGTGGYSSSIHFYERHYDKTGDIEDLAVLALKINADIDTELAEEYFEKLVTDQSFDEFCANAEGGELSNKQFYLGKYATVLVKNSKLDKALELAKEFVNENGYTSYNPYTVLLIELGESFSADELNAIKENIKGYGEASSDIAYIDELLK